MKLYYAKGACSLAPHIVMAELNMVYELESVDLGTKVCASGDFRKINAKGSVPALRMENGEILTEGAVISQYLADQKPEAGLLPKFGTTERYRTLEWTNYVATEIHKGLGIFFAVDRMFKTDAAKAEFRTWATEALTTKMNYVSEKLGSNDYLCGKTFTIADAYMFTCLSWANYINFDLSKWSNVTAYLGRVAARPAVQRAMKEEGLL